MKAVPQRTSPHIQRWAVTLRAYEYEIMYKPTPLSEQSAKTEQEDTVLMMEGIMFVSAAEMSQWTRKDPVLSRVVQFMRHGWPSQHSEPAFQCYAIRKSELSVQDGCVLCGARVVVPSPGCEVLLRQLHHGHPGITRLKVLARKLLLVAKVRC